MFCLQNQIYMLAPLLAAVGIANAQSGMAQPDEMTDSGTDTHVLVESLISGHAETIWDYHNNHQLSALEIDVVSKTIEGDYQNHDADVVEMSLHDAMAACERGDINLLPLDEILSAESDLGDYVWNGLQPCAVGHSVWADVITFDNTMYLDKTAPESMQDFFDINAFPGKRVLKRTPRALAEWSQIIAGVAQQDVYPLLSSKSAWSTLESALQMLMPEVIWVDSDRQALELLDNGTATFALVSSYKLVRQITEREESGLPHDHYSVIWNGAIAHMSMLTIPKLPSLSATQAIEAPEKTLDFLRYVAQPLRNLHSSTAFGYAPANKSHVDFIESKYQHALPIGLQLDSVIWGNDKWWRESGSEIEKSFQVFIRNTGVIATAEN